MVWFLQSARRNAPVDCANMGANCGGKKAQLRRFLGHFKVISWRNCGMVLCAAAWARSEAQAQV
jgi:hypothetical protein